MTLTMEQMAELQNSNMQDTFRRERVRLLNFIRQRVNRQEDAEDILQDVFYELLMMNRLMKPVEHLASWMFTVARNKITDLYRKKKPMLIDDMITTRNDDGEEENQYLLAEILPSVNNNAEDKIMSNAILTALADALDEMPKDQREVFIWHELEDKSFKEIEALTGVSLNTLLSRKRYAVLFLRQRLQHLYDDLNN